MGWSPGFRKWDGSPRLHCFAVNVFDVTTRGYTENRQSPEIARFSFSQNRVLPLYEWITLT